MLQQLDSAFDLALQAEILTQNIVLDREH